MSMHCPCGCSRIIRGVHKSGAVLAYREVQRTMMALFAAELQLEGDGQGEAGAVVASHLATGATLEHHLCDHLHGLATARRSPGLASLDQQVHVWKLASAPWTEQWKASGHRAG